jgi:hypothetical protein
MGSGKPVSVSGAVRGEWSERGAFISFASYRRGTPVSRRGTRGATIGSMAAMP